MSEPPPNVAGWVVAIAPLDPQRPDESPRLLLANAAVSTSGDAEQFVEIDGQRFSHIVDPRTGQALRGRSSVTVVAADGLTADSHATAVSVLGPKEGLELIEKTVGTCARFVQVTDQGRSAFESAGWKRLPRAD